MANCTRFFSRCLGSTSHRAPTTAPIRIATIQPTFSAQRAAIRSIHSSSAHFLQSKPPKSHDRGPKSDEDTQTDFSALDVLRNTAAPATSIDACTSDGFALSNQMRISGSGLLLVGGEAFRWRPWLGQGTEGPEDGDAMTGRLLNAKKQWEVQEGAWGVLSLVWPKPGMSRFPYTQSSLGHGVVF